MFDNFEPDGNPFRLLGVQIDCKLLMACACERIVKQAKPKCTAILRSQLYYDRDGLIQQLKTHVLCLLEGSNGAVFLVSGSCTKLRWVKLIPRLLQCSHVRLSLLVRGEQITADDTVVLRRSMFAVCRVYNFLPHYVVHAADVSEFQSHLTRDA